MMSFAPLSMVGPEFIVPKQPLEIIVLKYPGRNLVITDTNHTILLKVKPHDTTFHHQLQLLDADDNPIAMLREKKLSMHSTWKVFKGESKKDSDMFFSTKSEHLIQIKLNVSMTLANNTRSNGSCDMRIKGNWAKGSITIYMGDSSTAIAQMHKPHNVKSIKDKFTVTIQPNMDYAGVVALFAIVDAMEHPDEAKNSSALEAAGATANVLNAIGSLGNA
ncbi:protein LURP-one-related 10-like [Bidens hawaiensis]|uniref:protein LURP-one-related 10-like n=1 Tax=Bidens hawaiensis TaxID=980011 RepID=UPI004049062C